MRVFSKPAKLKTHFIIDKSLWSKEANAISYGREFVTLTLFELSLSLKCRMCLSLGFKYSKSLSPSEEEFSVLSISMSSFTLPLTSSWFKLEVSTTCISSCLIESIFFIFNSTVFLFRIGYFQHNHYRHKGNQKSFVIFTGFFLYLIGSSLSAYGFNFFNVHTF